MNTRERVSVVNAQTERSDYSQQWSPNGLGGTVSEIHAEEPGHLMAFGDPEVMTGEHARD
jgi:hypothetical protein